MIALVLAAFIAQAPTLDAGTGTIGVQAPLPAPEKSVAVVWQYRDTNTTGVFLSEAQAVKVANDLAAKQLEINSLRSKVVANSIPWWVWTTVGVLAGGAIGAAVGFAARK